jgi:SOS response regulatory protein OraA/RecX
VSEGPNGPSAADAKGAALLRWLARRPRSEAETRQRLLSEGISPGECEALIAEWSRLGYLDDRRLAYTYLSVRSARRLEGRRRLVRELCLRGLDETLVAEVAGEAIDDERERTHLLRLVERKLAAEGPPDGPRAFSRLVRFLGRRGFEATAIREVVEPIRPRGADDEVD